MYSYRVC